MKTRKPANQNFHIEAPAKITPLHVKNRNFVVEIPDGKTVKRIIAPVKGWRKLSPLERVYLQGQLAGGSPKHIAIDRFEAGKDYAESFDIAKSSGRDSTDLDRINKSAAGTSASQAQSAAIALLAAIDGLLSERDRIIVRRVCGDGEWPSVAVAEACGSDYAKATVPRFREAMDSLVEAFAAHRKNRGVSRSKATY